LIPPAVCPAVSKVSCGRPGASPVSRPSSDRSRGAPPRAPHSVYRHIGVLPSARSLSSCASYEAGDRRAGRRILPAQLGIGAVKRAMLAIEAHRRDDRIERPRWVDRRPSNLAGNG
jgi:hypothetical protein